MAIRPLQYTEVERARLETLLGRVSFSGRQPSSPVVGGLAFADATTWDPLGLGAAGGAYWVWWTGSTWRGLHERANGTNLS